MRKKKSPTKPKPGDFHVLMMTPGTPEWQAVYYDEEGSVFRLPIPFWATIEIWTHRTFKKGSRTVTRGYWETRTSGFVCLGRSTFPADEIDGFLGYDHPAFDTDFERKAKERTKKKKKPTEGTGGLLN